MVRDYILSAPNSEKTAFTGDSAVSSENGNIDEDHQPALDRGDNNINVSAVISSENGASTAVVHIPAHYARDKDDNARDRNIALLSRTDENHRARDNNFAILSATDEQDDASINNRFARLSAARKLHPSLFKVPPDQRKANPDAYTPFLFSFGPYHGQYRIDPNEGTALTCSLANALADGAYLKQITAEELLTPNELQHLVELIAQQKAQILAQYVQRLVVDTSEVDHLALLLAVDAITIVAATFSRRLQIHKVTPLIYPVARLALSDAMLLENQIPVFLLDLALESIMWGASAVELNLQYFHLEDVIHWYCIRANPFPDWNVARLPTLNQQAKGEPLLSFLYDHVHNHLTPTKEGYKPHSLHDINPSNMNDTANYGRYIDPSPPPASWLARCGVRFQVSLSRYVFFDNQNCVLFLPKIIVSDTAVRVIHNLLAYEATARLPEQYAFVSYVHLMDCLIDTADDVHILTDAGIICNKLGSHEELASMWNKLCISVSCRNTDSNRIIMAQLHALSKQRWRKWKASFREVYWERKPWLLLSIFAAAILLILSSLQTIFTILG